MATNSEFLRWNSSSFKLAIRQKLAENPLFTDFVFEDSNMTTLLDTFAYMYETMTYYVNSGAAEAMFTDAVFYENMNRIVKAFNYNPRGFNSAKVSVNIYTKPSTSLANEQSVISKYTSINTKILDSRGKGVYYSFIDDRYLNSPTIPKSNSVADRATLVNGRWRMYSDILLANGQPFEDFSLTNIVLDSIDVKQISYVAHPYMDVYVRDAISGVLTKYRPVTDGGLFTENSNILTPTDTVFELRLNESKQYVLRFGDGLRGKKLNKNDELTIVYLDGNGVGGEIGQNLFNDTFFSSNEYLIESTIIGMSTALYSEIVGSSNQNLLISSEDLLPIAVINYDPSTKFGDIETVDQIRENAPKQLRANDRLVTRNDIEWFVESTFSSDVYDCVAMNNYEYITKFMRYIYDIDQSIKEVWDENRTSVNPLLPARLLSYDLRRLNYKTADAADSNNIYAWVKYKTTPIDPSIIEDSMTSRKTITAEPIVMGGIKRVFVPCLQYDLTKKDANGLYFYDPAGYWDTCVENWIEVEKEKTAVISASSIKTQVINVFNSAFADDKLLIGKSLDVDSLYKNILSIPGVKRVRTAYLSKADKDANKCTNTVYHNGLSFASWDEQLVSQILNKTAILNPKTNDAAITMVNSTTQLEPFAFAAAISNTSLLLQSRIKIVSDSYSTSGIEY